MVVVNPHAPEPLHRQVECYLRDLVSREEYRGGKALPKEQELAKRLGVSRNTFRIAMDNLVREGLVTRRRGVGSFATMPKIVTNLSEWTSFSVEMDIQGREIRTFEKKILWIKADEPLALEMGIKPGTPVCRLDRLRGVSQEPVVLFQSYFHPRVEIAEDETFDDKLYKILEEKYHCVCVTSNEEIGAIPSTPELRKALQIHSDIPILYRKRFVMNPTDKLIELNYGYYRSDRFVYAIKIKRS